MLRGGTTALRIETGRRSGLKREERACRQCAREVRRKREAILVDYMLGLEAGDCNGGVAHITAEKWLAYPVLCVLRFTL